MIGTIHHELHAFGNSTEGIVTNQLEQGNLLMNVICGELNIKSEDILDFDLYLADATPACTFGVHDEFLSSGRLDDLSMCFAGLEAMINTEIRDMTKVLAIFDNEETGSQTKQGAGSPFLSMMLKRIALAQSGTEEAFYQAVERAFMISADNAHAWHPNYSEKYDPLIVVEDPEIAPYKDVLCITLVNPHYAVDGYAMFTLGILAAISAG